MKIYEDRLSTNKVLKVEHIPLYGWVVTGRTSHNAKKFSVVAEHHDGYAFWSRKKATVALETIKAGCNTHRQDIQEGVR